MWLTSITPDLIGESSSALCASWNSQKRRRRSTGRSHLHPMLGGLYHDYFYQAAAIHNQSKIVLTRGLRRLMDMLHTQAFLDRYREEHGALPPRIAA
jgi:hypothetical protein